MSESTALVELEKAVEGIEGVLGCVILAGPDDDTSPAEIQAFARLGTDLDAVRKAIVDEVTRRGLQGSLNKIFVFELEAESHFGDRESLQRAAEVAEQEALMRGPLSVPAEQAPRPGGRRVARRPPLRKVLLASSLLGGAEAEVVLGGEGGDVVGQARGEKTPHSLRVLAEATLHAAGRLVEEVDFMLAGASMVSVLGREAVMVLVRDGDLETVGTALVREGPTSEAAVRATLDAINRRLGGD
ncbi:MAG: hypothetical protein ACRDJJ_04770 [Actinomycetota bacterium]